MRPSEERLGDAHHASGQPAGAFLPRGCRTWPPRSKEAAPELFYVLLGNNEARLSGRAALRVVLKAVGFLIVS